MRLKGVISGRGQGLVRFSDCVDVAINNRVQANSTKLLTMHAGKQLKLQQLNESMYDCG